MIQTKDNNGVYHEVTKVFAGDTVQQEVIKIWSTDADDWVYEATDETSGALPLTFHADGSALIDYQIYGAAGGVGDRTENLFDKDKATKNYFISSGGAISSSTGACSDYIPVQPNTSYYIAQGVGLTSFYSACAYDSTKTFIAYLNISSINGAIKTPSDCVYVRLNVFKNNLNIAMLTEGSTPPASYVPYGYEVNISTSDGTNDIITPIYIGNEPLWAVNNYADYTDYQKQKVVRAIKKYVLTGEESWDEITGNFASRTYFRYVFGTLNYCVRHVCTCSHFTQANITTATTTVGFDVFDSTSVNGEVLAIRPSGVQSTTLEDFKAWLAEQYAAGTPVTVWCALTVAEEADPPVPLPALPTCEGTTVIDYDGTPAPSSVYVKYKKGW